VEWKATSYAKLLLSLREGRAFAASLFMSDLSRAIVRR